MQVNTKQEDLTHSNFPYSNIPGFGNLQGVASVMVGNSEDATRRVMPTEVTENRRNLDDRIIAFPNTNNNVIEGIRFWTDIYMYTVNSVLKSRDKIVYNQNDPLDTIIFKTSEGLGELYKRQQLKKFNQLIDKKVILENGQAEIMTNSHLCWRTLSSIFEKRFECMEGWNAFNDSEFEITSNVIVRNIDPLLEGTIKELEKIREEYFFSTFRILIDPNLNCVLKLQLTKDFFGFCKPDKLVAEIVYERMKFYSDECMQNLAFDFNKLQNLIDCLKKLKRIPKTYNNMAKGYNFLKKIYDFYKESLPMMRERGAQIKHQYPSSTCMFTTGYIGLCTYIKNVAREYFQILQDTPKPEPIKKDIQTPKNFGPRKKRKPNQTPKKKNQQNRNRDVKNLKVEKQETPSLDPKPFDQPVNTQYDNKLVVTANEITTIQEPRSSKNKEPINDSIKDKISETTKKEVSKNEPFIIDLRNTNLSTVPENTFHEEVDEEILEENNILMEILRQVCEKDRKQKLIIQEEKRRTKALELSRLLIESEDSSIEVTQSSQPQKLNKKHEETLRALLSENPPHLEISGTEVKNLIENELGGKLVGDGNGSKFKVFWQGSNKKAGMYEVAHGGDRDGYLTSEWAKKAGDAICVGVNYGAVALDIINLTEAKLG